MYSRFNLVPDGVNWDRYRLKGDEIYESNQNVIKRDLEFFTNSSDALEANKIIDFWFPTIDCQVFLSHSHSDRDTALGLAGFLFQEFKIKSFIDSSVWGYCDDLLREIDKKYCLNVGGKTYDYDKRNQTTSHVHTMLSTALMSMMDKTECVIFINTPTSFRHSNYDDEGKTNSPWIYSELAMTERLRLQTPIRESALNKSMVFDHAMRESIEAISVEYSAKIGHLIELSADDLSEWSNAVSRKGFVSWQNSLDVLYYLKKIVTANE